MKPYLTISRAGFIGSTLGKRTLKEGNNVIIIDNFYDYYDVRLAVKLFSNTYLALR